MNVTEEQISTLFWINLLVGAILGLLAVAIAPVVVAFYHEPRLFWVTAVLATGFLFNAAGVQHSALLQRQMRFTALAMIDIISLMVSTAVGIGMAVGGYGYWALVVMTVTLPFVATVCVVAHHVMDSGKAAQACGNSFHDAFRRYDHFEWPCRVRCL